MLDRSTIELLATLALVAVASAWIFFRHKYAYWQRKGIPFIKPLIPFGNIRNVGKIGHISQVFREFYYELKGQGPIGGIYFFTEPTLLVHSTDAIKAVLIKDFHNFPERGIFYNEKEDPLSAHLFALDGPSWKRLRSKLTPTFTSGKMKFMFNTVVDVADKFVHCLEAEIAKDDVLEMRELLARFTTDVIGTCAFGIECNSLRDPNAQFRKMGKKVFAEPRNKGAMAFLVLTFPNLAKRLKVKVNHDDISEFFLGIVRETVEYRERNNVRRNDFVDILIEMKNEKPEDGSKALTPDELAAQAFVFFLAGFETSSTTMSYALYELSQQLDIQSRARDEIRSVLQRHEGKLTYEAVMDMHYIERILNESMRKYPPVTNLIRRCKQEYKFDGTDSVIDAETLVMIPVYSIHHDADYYPDPERFDPDRFTAEAIKTRPHETFLPFGEGPRNCIGLRFGMMQAKIGLITLLRNYELTTCEQSVIPLEFNKTSIILTPVSGLFLKFRKL